MSRTRAQVVADQLVTDGIDRSRIVVGAQGATGFTMTSQESRRVEIAIGGR
jgi:outer membrane protein OmpA-like peptidoglycan-associated protein